jgi:hypothetical protein
MGTPAPDSAFFAQTTPAQIGFNLFRPDGRTFLSTGAFGNGSYSFTPDGRFACADEGCRMLRCTVNGRSETVDQPACRPLRREGSASTRSSRVGPGEGWPTQPVAAAGFLATEGRAPP